MHIKLIWFSVHAVLMMVLAMMIDDDDDDDDADAHDDDGNGCWIPRSVDIGHARALAIEVAHTDKEEGGD